MVSQSVSCLLCLADRYSRCLGVDCVRLQKSSATSTILLQQSRWNLRSVLTFMDSKRMSELRFTRVNRQSISRFSDAWRRESANLSL